MNLKRLAAITLATAALAVTPTVAHADTTPTHDIHFTCGGGTPVVWIVLTGMQGGYVNLSDDQGHSASGSTNDRDLQFGGVANIHQAVVPSTHLTIEVVGTGGVGSFTTTVPVPSCTTTSPLPGRVHGTNLGRSALPTHKPGPTHVSSSTGHRGSGSGIPGTHGGTTPPPPPVAASRIGQRAVIAPTGPNLAPAARVRHLS